MPIAIVTGASQGIGRAIVLRLARDGFDIGLNDLASQAASLVSLRAEINKLNRRACLVMGDVSVEKYVAEMVATVVAELGGLDVMVANAGIMVLKPMVDTSVEDWDRIQAVNARGVFLCYKYAARQMIRQGRGGRLIGATSASGIQGDEFEAAYGASKFAIRGLTQCAAKELGPQGITVNAYAPGVIDTPMHRSAAEAGLFSIPDIVNASPLRTIGTAEDVAGLVSFLASNDARFITGQTMSANGGLVVT